MRRSAAVPILACVLLAVAASACGGDDDGTAVADDRPKVVVTTTILGDVVSRMVGDHAEVQVLMPPGADPHDLQISARQAAEVREADALVVNGGGFEAGYLDALAAAEADGVPTYAAIDAVEALTFEDGAGHGHDEDEEDGHDEEEEGHDEGEEEDGHEGIDPHFFTDPDRMADAAEGIAAFLAQEVPELGTEAVQGEAAAVVEDLRALATDVEEVLAPIPDERRVLITNHEVFGYFADRYGFEVVGTVIPGGGTGAEPSARDLAALARIIEAEGVPAIFADVSSPRSLADALAREAGGEGTVEVVSLFSESLGEEGSGGATYDEMLRTNAERIVDALA